MELSIKLEMWGLRIMSKKGERGWGGGGDGRVVSSCQSRYK